MNRDELTDRDRANRDELDRFAANRREDRGRRDSSPRYVDEWTQKLDGPLSRMLGVNRDCWE